MEHHNGWCPQRTFHEACPWIHHLPPSFSIIMSFAPRDKIISKIKDVPPFCISAFEFSSSSVSSVAQSCPTLWDPMNRSIPGLPVHYQFLEFTQTHVHWVSDAIQPSHPLSSPSPPAFNFSLFSKESVLHIRWPKYWSFSFSISPSNEYSGLISFRSDWFHLLAVQETLKSLLQYHSSKASILQCSAFFISWSDLRRVIFIWRTSLTR